jgi:hypothetical protein
MSTTLKTIIGAVIAALLVAGIASAIGATSHVAAATAMEYGLSA